MTVLDLALGDGENRSPKEATKGRRGNRETVQRNVLFDMLPWT